MDPLKRAATEPTSAQDLALEQQQPHVKAGDTAVSADGDHATEVGREGGRTDHLIDEESGKALPRDTAAGETPPR